MTRTTLLATVASSAALIMAGSSTAGAVSQRQHAYECFAESNVTVPNGVLHSSPLGGANVYCPFADDDRFPKTAVTTLNVHGYSRIAGSVTAAACIKYYGSVGGACNTSSGSTATGVFTLSPAKTYWGAAYANDFAYVQVYLAPTVGGIENQLYGIFTAG